MIEILIPVKMLVPGDVMRCPNDKNDPHGGVVTNVQLDDGLVCVFREPPSCGITFCNGEQLVVLLATEQTLLEISRRILAAFSHFPGEVLIEVHRVLSTHLEAKLSSKLSDAHPRPAVAAQPAQSSPSFQPWGVFAATSSVVQ